jgi:hypothetical protein
VFVVCHWQGFAAAISSAVITSRQWDLLQMNLAATRDQLANMTDLAKVAAEDAESELNPLD